MTRDYIGGMEYVNDTLDAIYHSEGRIKYIDEVARYEYYIRDHLGNIRLTYSDLNADGLITTPDEIIEEMHYYPYGLLMDGTWMGSSGQYTYNGIEYETFLDLEMNLATYRGLDPTLGRWGQVDPKAELGYHLSPYNSMQNNPIQYSDPEGDWIHIAVGAVVGGIINTVTHWDDIKEGGLWKGVKAFGIGAGAGALTAATGAGVVGAGLIKGAAIGAGSAIAGDIFLQANNAWAFGDEYNVTQTLIAGGLGAFTGGLTGYLTKTPKGSISSNGGRGSFDLDETSFRNVKGSIRDDWKRMIGKEGIDNVEIHHIIPESIYNDFPELSKYFHVNDAIQNGIPLPNNWHFKHPAYTQWIEDGLNHLSSTTGINPTSLGQLRASAIYHLNQGVNSNVNTINQFWRNAPFILPFR